MKTAFYLFIISFLVTTFVAPFLLHRECEMSIINTKQDIRAFLGSINPMILQRIDIGQKEIHVLISIPEQIKLKDLSEHPNFSKFLSYKPSGDVCIACGQMKDYIGELNQNSETDGYYLYPKDALIK